LLGSFVLLRNKLKGKQIQFCKEIVFPAQIDITLGQEEWSTCKGPLVRRETNQAKCGMPHLPKMALAVIKLFLTWSKQLPEEVFEQDSKSLGLSCLPPMNWTARVC